MSTSTNSTVAIECPNFGETPPNGHSPVELCKTLHKISN
jgi:hypothetical protein